MTTRKSVKAVDVANLKPQKGFCVAYQDGGNLEWVPGSFAETSADCKAAIAQRCGIRWSCLEQFGHRVIPVTISPRGK